MPTIAQVSSRVDFRSRLLKNYTKRLIAAFAIGLAALAGSLRAEFVYVANQNSNNVSGYRVGADGGLTPVVGSPFPAGVGPSSVAVDVFGNYAYVSNQSGNVSAYRITSS